MNSRTPLLALGIFLAAMLSFGAIPIAAQDSARLIVTANTHAVYPTLTARFEEDPRVRFEQELRKLKEANPDAVLVEAGNFLSISYGVETAYSHPAIMLRDEMKYDVVNLSSRDAALGIVAGVAYQTAEKPLLDPLVSGLRSENPKDLEIPVALDVDKGLPLRFVSAPRLASSSGMIGKVAMLHERKPAELAWQVADARKSQRVSVVLAESDSKDLAQLMSGTEAPDVVITFAQGAASDNSGTWTIAAPQLGEIHVVSLKREPGGKVAQPEVETVRWLDAAQAKQLIDYPVPRLGFGIPNVENVVQVFFSADPNAVRVDRVPLPADNTFSRLNEAVVYHLKTESKPLRLYRIFSDMTAGAGAREMVDPGWPSMDMVVVLDENHNLDRVLNRTRFPVGMSATSLTESLNRLAGKDPATWAPDPETTAGIEDLWHWAVGDINRAIELDKKLYGPGGLLNTSED